jgi:PAS domain S-box-containing protein
MNLIDDTKTILEVIGIVFTGAVTIIGAIVGYIKKSLIQPFDSFKREVEASLENYNSILTEHTQSLKELKFNGGASVKDVVNKNNDKLDTISKNLDSIVAMVKASYEFENDGIFIADKHGNCYYFNKAYLDITGLSYNEALNFGWINAIHPRDSEKILSAWKTCVSTMSNMQLEHSYKNVKSKRVVKAKVSWQVQLQPTEKGEETILIFGRVKPIEK